MPVYDFRCAAGHVSERRASYDDVVVACPGCGLPAQRVAFYRDQQIIGDTVAGHTGSGVKDKHGRYRLDLMREAHHDLHEQHERIGMEMPDYQTAGRERAKSIRANQ